MIQKPDARRLFVRRYFYTLSVAQLAAESGLTESAVTARLYRLREALRKQLEKEGIEL
jgi:RNA polymerase sigma-70 factor (ECF subfamily)